MNYIGISSGFHDAAISVIDDNGDILFAGHSERYSKHKHDKHLSIGIIEDTLAHITSRDIEVHYYERPLIKYLRQLRSGEKPTLSNLSAKQIIGEGLLHKLQDGRKDKIHTHNHHLSHAAAGFQTSTYDDAVVVVIDAIGEFDTISVWDASYDKNGVAHYKKLWGQTYPDSIGLFYSAMTKSAGLQPLDEEYILMGMSAYGSSNLLLELLSETMIDSYKDITFNENLHSGLPKEFLQGVDDVEIAYATQLITEELISRVISKARMLSNSKNLVYGGGVALNCVANRILGNYYDNIWIMPNPGDAGSSLGAAALGYGKRLNWIDPYLGHNIPGEYPVNRILDNLLTTGIVGVASGRAEFGPRALGHRSLLADPRGQDIKDKVNEIKRRQKFRPFAPAILEEYADNYFYMRNGINNSRYMQFVTTSRHPDLFPAIVHIDGTSRVQTVPNDGSGIRQLLEKWYVMTGCPMLLNTSLNVRGEPMVNNREDADRFEKLYGIKVLS